ncbi:MAG: DUF3427 domain-containing protein [Akkermansiaceae bacterium]|nr:DUF3427 domain-containing protein [Akkermansiaceae bacterium]
MELPQGLYDLLRTKELEEAIRGSEWEDKAEWWVQKDKSGMAQGEFFRRLQGHFAVQFAGFLRQLVKEKMSGEEVLKELRRRLLHGDAARAFLSGMLPLDTDRLLSLYEQGRERVRPDTALDASALLTGAARTPSLLSQISKELGSCDQADWLVSFIKMSGINPLREELRKFTSESLPDGSPRLRVATTSYMGATDAAAIDFLRQLPNTEVRISYDTHRTRLHAKAYIFRRRTGFGSSYIGSANISRVAMDQGLEWTVKVSQRENPCLWADIIATFNSHWADVREFEPCGTDEEIKRLRDALASERGEYNPQLPEVFYELRPFNYQQQILDSIANERAAGKHRHLIVAATGTGKTMIAAFDFRRYLQEHPNARFLFLVHRKEILQQALQSFRQVLHQVVDCFGEDVASNQPKDNRAWFCTVQRWCKRYAGKRPADFFDYVVLDEAHHAAADSYQKLLSSLNPDSLLALTATPERADGISILPDFGGCFTHEIRLGEAIERALVVPFHYYGIQDEPGIDFRQTDWSRGHYKTDSLDGLLADNRRRAGWIIAQVQKYVADLRRVRAIGFCVSIRHAEMMAELCCEKGLRAIALTANSPKEEREAAPGRLSRREIQFIFTVDLYNEGVDIVDADTVLFLRPTESLTVFLQQLGRGLRRAPDKPHLDVFDFIARQNEHYDYEQRFLAMSGSCVSVPAQIQQGFPCMPTGCFIHLDQIAQKVILDHINAKAKKMNSRALVNVLRPLLIDGQERFTLNELMEVFRLSTPEPFYRGTLLPTTLCLQAHGEETPKELKPFEHSLARGCRALLLQTDAHLLRVFSGMLDASTPPSVEEHRMELSLLQSLLWGEKRPGDGSLASVTSFLWRHDGVRLDLGELLQWVLERRAWNNLEQVENMGVLRLHASYTRQQILLALDDDNTFEKMPGFREGVFHKDNIYVFFADIEKSEKDFSESTMYEDYALGEELFHWQSQNATSPESPRGQDYIRHKEQGIHIMLFIRRRKHTPEGDSAPYIFLGPMEYVSHEGRCPMSITWRMRFPIPARVLAWASRTEF